MSVMQEAGVANVADDNARLQAAWNQLNLVLSFYSRIDTKLSVVLGINLGMLALVGNKAPAFDQMSWWLVLLSALFALPLAASFYHLWRGAFPDLDGGTNSLVYFRSIAGMKESQFCLAFGALPSNALANDLLNQAWRNSKILNCKFVSLRGAFVFTLLAVPPWLAVLVMIPANTIP